MATIAMEGQGATLAFTTSTTYTPDILSITLPSVSREVIETTHLGTTSAKTFKPAKLKSVGTIEVEVDHNPALAKLIGAAAETITINYPLQAGEATAAKLVFNGFIISEGGEEFKTDSRLTTKLTIQVNGDMTFTPAVPA